MLAQPLQELSLLPGEKAELGLGSKKRSGYCPVLECRERFQPLSCLWHLEDTDTLSELLSREARYTPDIDVWGDLQPHISPVMRAILCDWVTEICHEFILTRETCHLTMQLVDMQMELTPSIQKSEYQLVAIAALSVACKFEEVRPPKMSDYELVTDRAYNLQQIKAMERQVLASSGWHILPGTLYHWLSWTMSQWDSFVESMGLKQLGTFKEESEEAYWRYLQAMTLADALLLDYRVLKIRKNEVTAGILYFVLGDVQSASPEWLELFDYFIGQVLAIPSLEELTPVLLDISSFSALPFALTRPKCVSSLSHTELLTGQTHLASTLKYVRRRMQT